MKKFKKINHVVHVTDNVVISRNSIYGKYGNREQAEQAAKIVVESLNVIKSNVNIPKNLIFIITKIPGSSNGYYAPHHNNIVINYCSSSEKIIETLCHELIHVDQVYRGDLSWKDEHNVVWKGQVFSNITQYTYDMYKNTPWEQEAFENQHRIFDLLNNEKTKQT